MMGFPGGAVVKDPLMQEMWVGSLGQEEPLEKEMATHSSILAWEILQTEEPSGLQSMGLQRVEHDLATKPPSTTISDPVLLPGKSHGWRGLVGCSP